MKHNLLEIYKNQSILNKLKFMGTFTALISMFISIILIIIYQYINEKNILKEQTKTFASILAENIAPAILFRDMDSVQQALNSIKYQKDIKQVYVMDKDLIIIQNYRKGSIPHSDFDIIDKLPLEKQVWTANTLYFTVPIIEHNQTLGFLMVLSSLDAYYHKLFGQLSIILLSMLFSIWVTLQFTTILRQAILSPIEDLNEHINSIIKTQNLDTQIEIFSQDEIGSLTKKFNTMIYDLKQMKNELTRQKNLAEHEASHDSLTSLLNRKSFTEILIKEIETCKINKTSLAVFFIDLDHFKEINDTLGHNIGDSVLKIFSKRINSCIRKSDIFARMGGDEFMLILKNIDTEALPKKMALKIINTMKDPIELDTKEIYLSASIGISHYPQDGDTEEILIKNADYAMYLAKNSGKNQYKIYKIKEKI